MMKNIAKIFVLVFLSTIVYAQEPISNGETGLSAREKINHSFDKISGLYLNESNVYNQSNESPKIVIIGDSRISALSYTLPTQLKNWLIPNGFTPFGDNGTSGARYRMVVSGATYKGDSWINSKEFGISGEVTKITSSSYIKWTADSNASGTKVTDRLWYDQIILFWAANSDAGEFRYAINEGSWTTIDCYSTVDSLGYTVIDQTWAGSMPDKRIRIEGVSDSVYMYGIKTRFTINDELLELDILGRGGSSAEDWANHTEYWKQYINFIQPTSIHISHGSNDIGSGRTSTQYIADLESIIDTSLTYSENADIVIWTQFDKGTGDGYATTDPTYETQYDLHSSLIKSLSKINKYSVFDERELMTNAETIAKYEFWSDGIHLNDDGNIFVCKVLRDYLTRYSASTAYANLYNNNYFTKGLFTHTSNNTYSAAQEVSMIGFYSLNSSGNKLYRAGFYMPNTTRLYLNIAGTDYYQFRTDYWTSSVEYVVAYIADSAASNNSLFRGSDHSGKLCYKDDSGVVHELY